MIHILDFENPEGMELVYAMSQLRAWLFYKSSGGGAPVAQWARSMDKTTRTSLSPIRPGFTPSFVNYKKGCTRFAAASDKDDQLLAQAWWFSPGTLPSSTTKTGCHDIAEILLKVMLNTKIQIQIQSRRELLSRNGIF